MSSARSPHPFLFTLLIIPFGAVSGFVSVVLAFLATKNGLTVEEGASLIAIGMAAMAASVSAVESVSARFVVPIKA